ncbi:hypothetical protein V6N13_092084 [Hibiscus sabdariffa]
MADKFQELREEVFRVFAALEVRRWLSGDLTSERITSLGWLKEQASGVYDLPDGVPFSPSLGVRDDVCYVGLVVIVVLGLAESSKVNVKETKCALVSGLRLDVLVLGHVEDVVEEMLQLFFRVEELDFHL